MSYHRFLRKSTYWRYGIFFLTVFFSYYSIQAYLNNISIESSIEQVRQDISEIEQQIAFKETFYMNYLDSEYAPYFLGHENGMVYDGERIIRFRTEVEDPDEAVLPSIEEKESIYLSTPEEAWHHFIDQRLEELIELGILE